MSTKISNLLLIFEVDLFEIMIKLRSTAMTCNDEIGRVIINKIIIIKPPGATANVVNAAQAHSPLYHNGKHSVLVTALTSLLTHLNKYTTFSPLSGLP